MAVDYEYLARLNDQQVLAALLRIDKGIDKIANDGRKAFDGVQKSANLSGVQIGAISGIVSSLTTQLINLGKAGIDALVGIGEQSVQTAIEMDTLKARLGGIFDGSQEAADQAFTFIQKKSKELGIDLSELAGAFIPKTENLAQFERVAKIATALARSDPEQGAIGARIALIEALSGTFTSLQRRFEIPKADIDRIKEAFDTKGIEGFLTTLETVLSESGKSFEDFTGTAQTSFSKLQIASDQILGRLGEPIVESLQQAADKILSFINENEDELIVFADTIGRSIGDAIDFIASIDLSQLDTSQLTAVATEIFNIIGAAELLLTQLGGLISAIDGSTNTAEEYSFALSNLDNGLVIISNSIAVVKAAFEAALVAIEPVLKSLEALAKFATGNVASGLTSITEVLSGLSGENFGDLSAAQDAFNSSLAESNKALAEYRNSVDGNKQAQDDLRTSLDETANAGTGAADAILGLAQANRQADADAEKLADAQAKVNEKMAEAEKDFSRKLEDIDIETERKRLDIAIEFAQKREDAARDNLEKLADINRKYQQDVDDAATDLARKEEDIARKFGQERIDLERENRQARLDIETDYRQKLQDIQAQFLVDAEEAERTRDAVAFLRAVRERDKKVQEAQVDRTREIEQQRVTNQQKLDELRIAQQRELEEAQIANERKLEDLRTNLNRQIEEQNIAYQRQLSDITLSEQRKNEELMRSRERDIEDARRAYARKIEDLKIALAEELAIIAEFAAKKAAIEAQANASSTNYNPSGVNYTVQKNPNGVVKPTGAFGLGGPQGAFASGGFASAKKPYIVGEKGPELFVPQTSGQVVPNDVMRFLSGGSGGSTYNSSSTKQINLSIPADRLTPGQRAEARQIALEVLAKI